MRRGDTVIILEQGKISHQEQWGEGGESVNEAPHWNRTSSKLHTVQFQKQILEELS